MINNFIIPKSTVARREKTIECLKKNHDERKNFWLKKINHMLNHVRKDEQFKKYIPKDDLDDLQQFRELPIFDKTFINKNIDITEYNSDIMCTGGSSGKVFKFPSNKAWAHCCRRNNQFARRRFCYSAQTKVLIWGHSHIFNNRGAGFQSWKQGFKDKLTKTIRFSAYKTEDKDLLSIIWKIKNRNIRHVMGYSSSLVLLINCASKNEISLPLDLITVTSEYLSPVQASALRKYTNAIIHQEYGSAEFGLMAYKYSDQFNYDILFDEFFMETDTEGQLIVTSLNRNIFPFIRFPIGDYVEEKNGFGLIDFNDVWGRKNDHIELLNGGKTHVIHNELITRIIENTFNSNDMFQVIFENNKLNIYSSGYIKCDVRDTIGKVLKDEIGLIPIIFFHEHYNSFEKTIAGKHLWIINKDQNDYSKGILA